jgi:formate-dependent nitrite reductase cytochrome c552 subunit
MTSFVPATSSSAAIVPPAATAAAPFLGQGVEMKSPAPTVLVAELAALGLAAGSLPSMDSLDPKALRGVMKLIARSLGAKCAECHVEGDFAAPTPRKRIAVHMWNEFAAKLEMDGGSPLFCDSCHHGRTSLLDRGDKRALGAWMRQNFVTKLQRKDAQAHDCETCHVNMEMKLLSKWGGL